MADPGHVATGTAEADAAVHDQPAGGAAAEPAAQPQPRPVGAGAWAKIVATSPYARSGGAEAGSTPDAAASAMATLAEGCHFGAVAPPPRPGARALRRAPLLPLKLCRLQNWFRLFFFFPPHKRRTLRFDVPP